MAVMRKPDEATRVVIVGAGFAGMEVAKALRATAAAVTIVDRHNYTLFQPLLYQVATAALSPADIAVPIRSLLHGSNMNAPDLAAQVVERVKTFNFGAKVVPPVTIIYPIDFLPAA